VLFRSIPVSTSTGMHEPGSLQHLERALDQAGLKVEHVRLVVCTHAHVDHCGQAPPIAEQAGCELWMHPNIAHATVDDPEQALRRRVEVARQSGVPEAPLQRWIEQHRATGSGQAGTLKIDRELTDGATVETDLGVWNVVETPGHAPSHICLHQPERRLLISGDHLLGRVSLYFDVGYTPDPVGEFLASLDKAETLDARLALSGHGRPFTDVAGHVRANRELVDHQLDSVRAALAGGAKTAFELAQEVYGEAFNEISASWLLAQTRSWLIHLEQLGEASHDGASPARWS